MSKTLNEKIIPRETSAGYLLDAQEFLVAAELVLSRAMGLSLPAYFLLGRSIELSLKAFLLDRGITAKELGRKNKFGHNLTALLEEAQRQGLEHKVRFNQQEIGVINLLSYSYNEKGIGYRVTGDTYYLPLIDVTESVARKLVIVLKAF